MPAMVAAYESTVGEDGARERFRELVADEPVWRDVLDRVASSELFPDELRGLAR